MSDKPFTEGSKVNASEEKSSLSSTGRIGRGNGSVTGAHEAVRATGRFGRSQATGAHAATDATGRSSIRKTSMTGAHHAAGNTGRLGSNTGRITGKTGSATAVTGIFTAASVTGRHEAYTAPISQRPEVKRKKKQKLYIGSVIAAALLVIVFAIAWKQTTQDKYQNYYANALQSFEMEDYDKALADARRAMSIRKTEEACLLMSECYQAEGNFEKALEVLRAGNTSDAQIIAKIQAIEALREEVAQSQVIAMAGVKYAPDTTIVNLSGTESSNEQFEQLAQLTKLTELSFARNHLESLSGIEQLLDLVGLDLSDNALTRLDGIAALTHLRTLILDGNEITSLTPLYTLQNLTTLSIRNTAVSEEERMKLAQQLPCCAIEYESEEKGELRILLGDLDFSVDVEELDLSGRGLTDLTELSLCTRLKKLNLSGNHLTDVAPLMDLSGLEWLDLHDNSVADLRSLIALSNLTYVDASENCIYSTNAFGAMNALKRLKLDHNEIADFSGLKNCANLVSLSLNDTGLKDSDSEYLRNMKNLYQLYICDNPDFSGEAFERLNHELSGCGIEHSKLVYSIQIGTQTYRQDITELNASGQKIRDLKGISSFENLQTIDLSDNDISDINLLQYLKSPVVRLDLSDNRIGDAAGLTYLTTLKELDLSNNQIQTVNPLLGLKNLIRLDLRGNNLSANQLAKLREALPCCEIIV